MAVKQNASPWTISAVISLIIALLLDAVALGSEGWGWSEEEQYFNSGGLWRFCNGTRHWDIRAQQEIAREDPKCKEFRLISHGKP